MQTYVYLSTMDVGKVRGNGKLKYLMKSVQYYTEVSHYYYVRYTKCSLLLYQICIIIITEQSKCGRYIVSLDICHTPYQYLFE